MGRQGFFYNQARCVGCKTCQIACKDKNNLPVGILFRRVSSYETGQYPNPGTYHFAATCNHCAQPACVAVCPVDAMHVEESDGTVQHNDAMCIGCQYCVHACPYGNPRYIIELMTVHKCDACMKLRQVGERPACVASCPSRALDFGPIADLQEQYPDMVNALPILPDPEITAPSLLVKPRATALLQEYREMYE
jgi:anaerobic dimethyl sulfoxide reductase subunit B (iron-sulfur subunit)